MEVNQKCLPVPKQYESLTPMNASHGSYLAWHPVLYATNVQKREVIGGVLSIIQVNIIFFSLLDSDWLKTVPIKD